MAELPEAFREVELLRPQEGDVMVLTIGTPPSPDQIDLALEELESVFPLNKCVVLGPFDTLRVVRTEEGYEVPEEAVERNSAPAASPASAGQSDGG